MQKKYPPYSSVLLNSVCKCFSIDLQGTPTGIKGFLRTCSHIAVMLCLIFAAFFKIASHAVFAVVSGKRNKLQSGRNITAVCEPRRNKKKFKLHFAYGCILLKVKSPIIL